MPQEQNLLPYINKAYGQGTQLPSIEPFRETFNKQAEEKKQDYKSAAELGIELDAKGWGQWSKDLEKLYNQAADGSIVIGSPEWMAGKQKIAASASQLKQTQDLTKELSNKIQENPDQYIFRYQNENGEEVIGNHGDFLNQMGLLYEGDYANQQELINKASSILQSVNALPMGVGNALKEGQQVGMKISEYLQEYGMNDLDIGTKDGVWFIKNNQKIDDPTLTAKLKQEINTLSDQYRPYLETKYQAMTPPNKRSDDGLKNFIENTVKSWLFPYKAATAKGGQLRATKDDENAPTGKELEESKNVKPDVYKAQQSNNPVPINKYLRGSGYQIESGSDGLWDIVVLGKAKGESGRVIDQVNPNQAEEVYNAIAEYGNMNREAIDRYEFNPVEQGNETPEMRELRADADENITALFNIDKVNTKLKNDKKNAVTPDELLESIKKKFNISDVEIIDIDDGKPSKIKIGDKNYDLSDKEQAKMAFDALRNKMIGATSDNKNKVDDKSSASSEKIFDSPDIMYDYYENGNRKKISTSFLDRYGIEYETAPTYYAGEGESELVRFVTIDGKKYDMLDREGLSAALDIFEDLIKKGITPNDSKPKTLKPSKKSEGL